MVPQAAQLIKMGRKWREVGLKQLLSRTGMVSKNPRIVRGLVVYLQNAPFCDVPMNNI